MLFLVYGRIRFSVISLSRSFLLIANNPPVFFLHPLRLLRPRPRPLVITFKHIHLQFYTSLRRKIYIECVHIARRIERRHKDYRYSFDIFIYT